MVSKQLVWLVTGTSAGFGRELVLQILQRGDKVIATARGRSFSKLADLKEKGAETYELDVNASLEDLHAFAKNVVQTHGQVDVVVNNAGYIEINALEVSTPEDTLNQFNTNVFAPINISRAFLPYMRERKTGTIVWIGSVGGWRSNVGGSLYSASKHAVRALSEGLDSEIKPFGLRSICIEPGYFRTAFLREAHTVYREVSIPEYEDAVNGTRSRFAAVNGKQPGDPQRAASVIVDIVKGEGAVAGRQVPSVIALGSDAYGIIKGVCEGVLERLETWKDVTCSSDLPK